MTAARAPDEEQTLIPAKDLHLFREVEYLKAETVITEDTDVEKIASMSRARDR